jgi:FAD/FMN-containing dehydrogenase
MVTRRNVLAGVSAALVYGFDPVERRWVADAHARGAHGLPPLHGRVVTDAATLATYADDVGNIVRHTPRAVLLPGSVEDIQAMVRYARRHGLEVAARGQGHTTYGQSQVAGGLSIDMRSLGEIHSIDAGRAVVDAGATWRQLVEASVPLGLTPPVLTGYVNLTIGGTLSVGGVSSSNDEGVQVDRVQALQVVTGEGDIEWCSEHRKRELFEAVLAGLGQCAIIVKVIMDMVPAPAMARVYSLNHTDNASFFSDLRTLLKRGEFDDTFMLGAPNGAGGWVQQLNAVRFFEPGEEPDGERLLRGLEIAPAAIQVVDQSYLDYVLRVDAAIEFFRSIGLFDDVLHPWLDVWLPEASVESYVGAALGELAPEDVGATGFLLLFPQKRKQLTRPFFRVPDTGEWVFLFDILTAAEAPGPNPEFLARMLARNRRLYEQARGLGGTFYPIGAIPLSQGDWRAQYGQAFSEFSARKRRFDPDGILTPGPGIFRAASLTEPAHSQPAHSRSSE